jgi:MoaA/NifB/PqqE/SkfB family radical SAM enzyme
MTRWNPKNALVHLSLSAAVKGLGLIPDGALRRRIERSKKDLNEPSSGDFLFKLFSEVKRRRRELSPNCLSRLVHNLVGDQILLGTPYRKRNKKELTDYPHMMVISPTMRCNLKCVGCYSAYYNRKDALSTADLDRVYGEAKDLGIRFVVVSGGEPFIREDFLELCERHSDMIFMTYTNGTLIAERQLAPRLAKLGNVIPCISVEGFEKETTLRRGVGVWSRILATMAALKEAGVIFGFSGTPTRLNNDLIVSDEFIDFYVERGCMIGWYFSYMPVGRDPDLSLMPTPEQRLHRMQRIREIRANKPIVAADFWCDGPLVGGCLSAGRRYFHVNAQGGVEPCVFHQFHVHNIKDVSLKTALSSDYFKYVRQRNREVKNIYRPCPIIDRPQILRDALDKFHPMPSQEGAYKIKNVLADGLDEYAVNLKRVMDPVWQSEFPDAPETVDDSQHVGEHGRSLLKGDGPASGRPPLDVHKRAAAAR